MTDDKKRLMMEGDDAAHALACNGYSIFRNGRILIPDGHEPTDEEMKLFDVIKAAYPHSVLL